ncbi:hypothetical protein Btus_0784 [Kyrpidia tusciae DSM 2912]|uniref:Uncharacterized protein n=1 Tax=Kyrpidia tusciae (strain DSM 2912 / NBRC 15312 / T2) TaxID=562970 RepID=D5WVD3_KYRT2|nr:hypothetical protein Btus_0784 [Kyrpidia tusciae DSM 2912]
MQDIRERAGVVFFCRWTENSGLRKFPRRSYNKIERTLSRTGRG